MKQRKNYTLRQRMLPSGNVKLYVDVTGGGRRRTESLGLFLVPEQTRSDRVKNKETLRMAEAAVAKMVVDEQRGRLGLGVDHAEEIPALEYLEEVAARSQARGTAGNYLSLGHLLCRYDRFFPRMSLAEVDREWLHGFRTYLAAEPFRPMTRLRYWSNLNAVLNKAVKDGLLPVNPAKRVDGFSAVQTERNYLTIDELRTLAGTPCEKPAIKRAFLFGCVTGLRISDIRRLTWGMVIRTSDGWRMGLIQQKTGGMVYIDLSAQALRIMGPRGERADAVHVFDGLHCASSLINMYVERWCLAAGITRHITFHCSRHTFAVSLLSGGTDIYTVSRLLGHTNLATTQVYAHIVDERKRAAVEGLPDILGH